MQKANSIHDTIKFTHKVDVNSLTFLETTIYKGLDVHVIQSSKLDIKTHIKHTNKQLYVHASSYQLYHHSWNNKVPQN